MALDGREVRHWAEVHDFLDVALGEHRKARLATAHDIGMIAEDVERVARERTCAYVEDAPAAARPAILYMLGIMRSRPCDAV